MVRKKSNFIPPKGGNQALDHLKRSIESIPLDKTSGSVKDNVIKHEREAIKTLSSDTSIVIKEADRSGSVVIMDKEHF